MNVHLTSLVILKSLSLFVCDILIGYLEANIAENEENCAVKMQPRMNCLFLFEQLGSQVNYRPQVSPSTGGSHLGIQHHGFEDFRALKRMGGETSGCLLCDA